MKKFISILFLAVLVMPKVFPQNKTGAIEAVGKGVIDFLLENPNANRMDPTAREALDVVGRVLETIGTRKHAVNLAAAGANKMSINNNLSVNNPPLNPEEGILINSPEGQAMMFQDNKGNLFLLYEGKIYPIAEELVNQAKEFSSESNGNKLLEPYNLEYVKNNFHFSSREKENEQFTSTTYLVSKKGGEYLSDIARENGVTQKGIWIKSFGGKVSSLKKILEGKDKLNEGSILVLRKFESPGVILRHSQVNFIFTSKWANDFAEDGYGFDDFQGIRNYFSKREDFIIVTGYQNDSVECKYSLTIFAYETGIKVFEETNASPVNDVILITPISLGEVSQGIYIINFKIKKDDKVLDSKIEKFEITE